MAEEASIPVAEQAPVATNLPEHINNDPAQQFIAVIGDDNSVIRPGIKPHVYSLDNDSYSFDNYYYAAKFGIKDFSEVSKWEEVLKSEGNAMPCLFLFFKSLSQLEEVGKIAEKNKVDTRVVFLESEESCADLAKVTELVCKYEFEIHYLKMSQLKDQLEEAAENCEKVYFDRVFEIITICCWPWRSPTLNLKSNPLFDDVEAVGKVFEERRITDFIDRAEAERMHRLYWDETPRILPEGAKMPGVVQVPLIVTMPETMKPPQPVKILKVVNKPPVTAAKQPEPVKAVNKSPVAAAPPVKTLSPEKLTTEVTAPIDIPVSEIPLPAPGKVELVHLPPSSPSDMEDGPLTLEDVTISVDINLICQAKKAAAEQKAALKKDKTKKKKKKN